MLDLNKKQISRLVESKILFDEPLKNTQLLVLVG